MLWTCANLDGGASGSNNDWITEQGKVDSTSDFVPREGGDFSMTGAKFQHQLLLHPIVWRSLSIY